MTTKHFLFLMGLFGATCFAQVPTRKALFDNTKNETAENADWIIDTDQPVPFPAQSGITSTTPETYWLGGISAWGVDLVKRGFTVHTLTRTYGITFGNPNNPYDLSRYDLFVVCEPQNPITATEKQAIVSFVANGGGLFMVADHDASDRDNDGWDSPKIWNSFRADSLFGIHFQSTGESDRNISQTATNICSQPDEIMNGAAGTVSNLSFYNGTTMPLLTSFNPTATGHVWMNGAPQGTAKVMASTARYQRGRVAAVGDSSPADDSTGQPGNRLYNGWNEPGTTNSTLFLNLSLWLVSDSVATAVDDDGGAIASQYVLNQNYPNPFNPSTTITYSLPQSSRARIEIFDVLGKRIKVLSDDVQPAGNHAVQWDGTNEQGVPVSSNVYVYRATLSSEVFSRRMVLLK